MSKLGVVKKAVEDSYERVKPGAGVRVSDRCSQNGENAGGTRAESEIVGVIFLLSISIVSIGAVLLMGRPILLEMSGDAHFDSMENEFSLIDAGISTSALGTSKSQSVSLNTKGGILESNPDASWMRIEHSSEGVLANVTMGNVRYVQGDRTLAYEGGGIWKSEKGNDFTEMVSTPEFHYRGSTLTLPMYNITSRVSVSGSVRTLFVEAARRPELKFPDQNLDNPLEVGSVIVTVKSEYYRGWASYFRDKTSGSVVKVDDKEQKVFFELTVPREIDLTGAGGLRWITDWDRQGSADVEEEQIDSDAIVDPEMLVDPMVSKCFPNPENSDCENLENNAGKSLDEDTMYYIAVRPGKTHQMDDYAAPNGNVTIVANGTVEYYGEFAVGDDVAEPVEVYVDGDLGLQGNARVNVGGPDGADVNGVSGSGVAEVFVTYVTGGVPGDEAGGSGGAEYTGIIYAPNTMHNGVNPCQGGDKFAGTPTIKGAIIANSFCASGNGVIQGGNEVGTLKFPDEFNSIRFLHITENKVEMSE